jgi:putative transposase
MPNPYPLELRERAVAAYETGEGSYTEVARQLRVDRSTLIRWVQQARATGSVASAPKRGGWTSPIDASLLERLIRERPDMTTDELTRAYNREVGRRARVHRSSVLRALHRQQFVFKKNGRDRRNRIVPMCKPSGARSSSGPDA